MLIYIYIFMLFNKFLLKYKFKKKVKFTILKNSLKKLNYAMKY